MPMLLTGREVAQHAYNAGFRGSYLVEAVAIAKAESKWDAAAVGDKNLTEPGEQSTGLWQINFRPSRDTGNAVREPLPNYDPATNARNAYTVFSQAGGRWTPWSTYTNGDYRAHLDEAYEAASGVDTATLPDEGSASDTQTGTVSSEDWPEAGSPVEGVLTSDPSKLLQKILLPKHFYRVRPGGSGDRFSQRFLHGKVDLTSAECSQVTFTFWDWDFRLLREGYGTRLGSPWKLTNDLIFAVMTVATEDGGGGTNLTLTMQPYGVYWMKDNTAVGAINMSATEYVEALAKACRMSIVTQDTPKRDQIVPVWVENTRSNFFAGYKGKPTRPESPWELAQRLAQEEGFLFFESGNVLYFAKPSYIQSGRPGKHNVAFVSYLNTKRHDEFGIPHMALKPPICTGTVEASAITSTDSINFHSPTITVTVDRESGTKLRTGMNLYLRGVPRFEGGGRMITRVTWDHGDKAGSVVVQAEGIPDPVPTSPGGLGNVGDDAPATPTDDSGPSTTGRLSTSERTRYFGPGWPNGTTAHCKRYETPWGITVWVHNLIFERFRDACTRCWIEEAWRPAEIGSFNNRPIGGTNTPSLHSWGLAFDFFNTKTPSDVWGPKHAPPASFRTIFEEYGFYSGARFSRRPDYPHIEWPYAPPGNSTRDGSGGGGTPL